MRSVMLVYHKHISERFFHAGVSVVSNCIECCVTGVDRYSFHLFERDDDDDDGGGDDDEFYNGKT